MAEDQFWIGVHGVIADAGEILVLKRAPRMSYKPGAWDLPGGHLKLGEMFEECLAREIEEETGLRVRIERLLGLHNAIGPYVQAIYACGLNGPREATRLQPWEHVEFLWARRSELSHLELIPYLEGVIRLGMLDYVG